MVCRSLLISVSISQQSSSKRDGFRSRKREPVSHETVSERDIRSISVRIDESIFARTDVPKGTSASISTLAGGTL